MTRRDLASSAAALRGRASVRRARKPSATRSTTSSRGASARSTRAASSSIRALRAGRFAAAVAFVLALDRHGRTCARSCSRTTWPLGKPVLTNGLAATRTAARRRRWTDARHVRRLHERRAPPVRDGRPREVATRITRDPRVQPRRRVVRRQPAARDRNLRGRRSPFREPVGERTQHFDMWTIDPAARARAPDSSASRSSRAVTSRSTKSRSIRVTERSCRCVARHRPRCVPRHPRARRGRARRRARSSDDEQARRSRLGPDGGATAILAIKTIKHYHQFPFWNPYSCGGHTWWGGLENGVNLVSPFFPVYMLSRSRRDAHRGRGHRALGVIGSVDARRALHEELRPQAARRRRVRAELAVVAPGVRRATRGTCIMHGFRGRSSSSIARSRWIQPTRGASHGARARALRARCSR